MPVKQVSVFLENKEGRLYEMCRALGNAGINMRALCVAETMDYGVVRLIADNPKKAVDVLRNEGFTVAETDVLAVEIPDRPGGLADVLGVLARAGINVEYLYCFVEPSGDRAIDVMRVEDIEGAMKVLEAAGINVVHGEDIYSV
jgi:hypothetical protein